MVKKTLTATLAAAVLTGSLAHAPAAVAAPPQPSAAKSEACERVGDTASAKADCVTLKIVSDSSTDVGEDIRVKGRVHASKRQGKTRVVIERAIDGGDWHDEGNRWTKVTTVDVDPSGRFATDILIHRRGLHTLRVDGHPHPPTRAAHAARTGHRPQPQGQRPRRSTEDPQPRPARL